MYSLGVNGMNGAPDIFSYRCNYDKNKVVVSKLTNASSFTCTATISNGTIHFTFNGTYIMAAILKVS